MIKKGWCIQIIQCKLRRFSDWLSKNITFWVFTAFSIKCQPPFFLSMGFVLSCVCIKLVLNDVVFRRNTGRDSTHKFLYSVMRWIWCQRFLSYLCVIYFFSYFFSYFFCCNSNIYRSEKKNTSYVKMNKTIFKISCFCFKYWVRRKHVCR